jgi:SEC-C motif
MEPENLETAAKLNPVRASDPVEPTSKESRNATVLVRQMVEAGEWPAPELMEQIVNAGDEAVEPLLALLRAKPTDHDALYSLSHAMGLLSVLKPPEAIAELVKVVEHYHEELCANAADALAEFGTAGFDVLIRLCSSASIKGYQRVFVFDSAVYAAGADPARKTRLAECLRPILDDTMTRAREEKQRVGWLEMNPPDDDFIDDDEEFDELDQEEFLDEFDEPDDDSVSDTMSGGENELAAESNEHAYPEPDDFEAGDDDDDDDDDEVEIEPFIAEEVGFLVGALATLADPLAHDTIMTAYREGLVDETITSEKFVDEHYAGAGESTDDDEPDLTWVQGYRLDYEAYMESMSSPPLPPKQAARPKYRYEDRYDEGEPPPDTPATIPIRNTQAKLGRNDPCWCGSGKKFKKCHLGKDGGDR